ncbi:MAG: type II secretion system protein GspG [Planctomycetaceae bacterium]|jgi:general secretion pathway protein G|nr:type II secretion system protein GspG [Planctomycetaceae bacterium]MDP7274000.1 type II secretion system major pseudopilin GspG [Planctomycetaceae bacterium]
MKNYTHKTKRRHGFTLLEVLLVLAILIAIAAMVVPNLIGRGDEANKDITRINIANFEKAAQMYRIDNKRWPEGGAQEVLELLMEGVDDQGRQRAPYLDKIPMDAWDQPLLYEYPTQQVGNTDRPLIYSLGPNGIEGGDDDITNLDEIIEQQNL